MIIATLVTIALMLGFWYMTREPELRSGRYWRLVLSLPFAFGLGKFVNSVVIAAPLTKQQGFSLISCVLVLSYLWRPVLAWHISNSLVGILNPDLQSLTGGYADFKFAHSHLKDGNLREVERLARHELAKDGTNYEGRMLLCKIYYQMEKPAEAMAELRVILDNPKASEAQKEAARGHWQICEDLQTQLYAAKGTLS